MQEKEVKDSKIVKKEAKLFLADDMSLYVGKPKESTKKNTRTEKQIEQVCRVQNQYTKVNRISIDLLSTIWKWNYENSFIPSSIKKMKIGINLTKEKCEALWKLWNVKWKKILVNRKHPIFENQ